MFRRESSRERALLRLIEQQQQIIREQNDRLMVLAGKPWSLPPLTLEEDVELEPAGYSALDVLPDEWGVTSG